MSATPSPFPLPNFLIIGAARCGTTTLYSYLREHPEVYLPPNKRPEPHFFLKTCEYSEGLDHYRNKHFAAWSGQPLRGECSTSYLCHEWVAERIRRHLPDVKLVVILRNPVDRAWSSYWHTRTNGLESLSFEEALDREDERLAQTTDLFWKEVRPFAYQERGFYHRQLSAYLRHFPRERLHIILLEDLQGQPSQGAERVLRDLLKFLDADPDGLRDSPDLMENSSDSGGERMMPATRVRLIETYRTDVQELSLLLGRDLAHWSV